MDLPNIFSVIPSHGHCPEKTYGSPDAALACEKTWPTYESIKECGFCCLEYSILELRVASTPIALVARGAEGVSIWKNMLMEMELSS